VNEETELKLRVPERALASIRRSPLLTALRQGRGARRHLLTVYYDTPSLALARKGLTLRVRRTNGRWVQGIKLADEGGGTVQRRPEIETEIEGDTPDIARIPDDGVRQMVSDTAGLEPLSAAFVSDFGRTTWPVRLGGSDIEVALDVGEIRTEDDRKVAISELELELKSGHPDKLLELALALGRSVPISVERATKAARGFALVTGAAAEPVRARPIKLAAEATVAEAFAALARNCLAQLGGNEAAVLAGSVEGLHQMRVAARRLRALIACFRGFVRERVSEELMTELRWLMGALGPARDLDVFIVETLDPLVERCPEEPSLAVLRDTARQAARTAHLEAGAALAAPRYTQFLLTVDLRLANGDWAVADGDPNTPVRDVAGATLKRRYRRLVRMASGHRALEIEELHEIRIRAKKMRYAGEFFRSLYSRKLAARHLLRLTRLQDRLGSLNDAVTGRALLDRLLPESGLEAGAAARTAGFVLGWKAAQIHADLAVFGREWEEFRELRPFWARS
jgi:inorganic triphosphatase YgiF